MVTVFRGSEARPAIVDTVLEGMRSSKVIWAQLGIVHEGAAERVRASGLTVVRDHCLAIEYQSLC